MIDHLGFQVSDFGASQALTRVRCRVATAALPFKPELKCATR